jgi:catechol-2,3-dioxygenase
MMGDMGIGRAKRSVDIGIVVRDAEASLALYRDVLGLEHTGRSPCRAVRPRSS